jgi:hypothetical protein
MYEEPTNNGQPNGTGGGQTKPQNGAGGTQPVKPEIKPQNGAGGTQPVKPEIKPATNGGRGEPTTSPVPEQNIEIKPGVGKGRG